MDLDQPGTTAKPVKMVAVAYVPGLSRNLLSTRKAVEQWGTPLVYHKTKAVLGFPEEETLVFNFCPRKGLFSATGVRRIPGQGTAVAVAAKTHDMIAVHRMLAHPSEEITRKMAEAMGIVTTGQWGPREAIRRAKNDGQKSKRERKTILRRPGWADETLEPRREQLRRHFCGRLHPIQGGKIR